MKITKSQLKQVIKEEIISVVVESAGEQKYCCIKGEPFKLVDYSDADYLMVGCSPSECKMMGTMPKEEFKQKLNIGEFKPV